MSRYVIKRVLMMIPMLLVITFIVFSLLSLSNVDPAALALPYDATEEQRDEFRQKIGYYDPFFVKYFRFVVKAVQGDFGSSYYDPSQTTPIFKEIMARWPYTIILAFSSIIIAMVIGIPLGVLAAVKQYSVTDRVFTTTSMLLAAIPTFCIATIFMLIFSYQLKWVPAGGVTKGLASWILPSMTLGISYSAAFLRYTRSSMLETIRQDYIRTAKSKGAKEKTVIWTHAFRNALLPLITITGMMLGGLLGGAVIMESVFVIPGLGQFVLKGIHGNDIPVVMASITMLSLTFLVIMIIVDILYGVADPRVKARYIVPAKRKVKAKGAKNNA